MILFLLACSHKVAEPPLPAGDACTPEAVAASGELCAYDTGLLAIASAFAAKEACSCVFVAGRTEEECAAWVRVSPAVASWRVDERERRVVAHALGLAKTSASFVDERVGCRLDP